MGNQTPISNGYTACVTPRKVHIELLRFLAIFFVVWNHTPAYHMPFHVGDSSIDVFAMLCLSALCKFAVPVFFMISGALLIPKQETIGTLLKKRVFRFCLVIFLFVSLQYAYYHFTASPDAQKLGWTQLIIDLYQGNPHSYAMHADAIWFLYAYMGLLLTMPFLRLIGDRIAKCHIIYMMIVLCMLAYIAPFIFSILTGHTPDSNGILARAQFLTGPGAFLVYAMLGHYIENIVDINKVSMKICIFLMLIICFCCLLSALSEVIISQCINQEQYTQTLVTFKGLLPVMCGAVYLLAKKLCANLSWPPLCVKLIGNVGAATFTVFLTEAILRRELSFMFVDLQTNYISSWGLALVVTFSGIVMGLIIKRIPLLNKII